MPIDERLTSELLEALHYIDGCFIEREGEVKTYGGPIATLDNIRVRTRAALRSYDEAMDPAVGDNPNQEEV